MRDDEEAQGHLQEPLCAQTSVCFWQVQKEVYRAVAKLLGWSMECAAAGVFPRVGFAGEEFHPKSLRAALKGKPLAAGWRLAHFFLDVMCQETKHVCVICVDRAAYLCTRYDGKARAETNLFDRNYRCRFICESCMAQNPVYRHDPLLSYQDFRPGQVRHLTVIDDATYRRTCRELSPWSAIPGWTLPTCLHDLMHVVYLGTARDLIPSLLGDFLDHGVLGDTSTTPVNTLLRSFSIDMHKVFRQERTLDLETCVWKPLKLCVRVCSTYLCLRAHLHVQSVRASKDQCSKDLIYRKKHRAG